MALSSREAFLVPVAAAEVGVPFFGLRVVERARESAGGDPALTAQLDAQERALRGLLRGISEPLALVEDGLASLGLRAPARPLDFDGYLAWANASSEAVLGATRPDEPAGALAMLGRCAGELIQIAMTLAGVLHLRISGDLPVLQEYDARLGKRFAEWSDKLERASRFSTLPEAARAHAAAMAQAAVAAEKERGQLGGADGARACRVLSERLGGLVSGLAEVLGKETLPS